MYKKNAAIPTSGNSKVLSVIFGFGDSIYLLHPLINRRKNEVSAIICFVHFRHQPMGTCAIKKTKQHDKPEQQCISFFPKIEQNFYPEKQVPTAEK